MIADDLSRLSMSAGLATTVSRAFDFARSSGHPDVTLEHMLIALCEDPDAALVLAASNIDVARLNAEVSDYLAGIETRQGAYGQNVDPSISPDLLRILEAAAAAARGGRRREINGAIVLAAIVGDGKSPAAQLLRAQGLTFEGAIRALQAARQATPTTAPPSAGDILASARERVQARARGPVRLPAPAVEQAPSPPESEPAPEPDIEEVYAEIGEPIEEVQEAEPAAIASGAGSSDWRYAIGSSSHYEEPPGEESAEEEGSMPASAPFPPPLPVPGTTGGKEPFSDDAMASISPRTAPPPLPPAAPVRVGAASEPRSSSVPWPDALPPQGVGAGTPPAQPKGVGSGSDFRLERFERPRVEGIGAADPPRPTLAERARRFEPSADRAPPSLGAARPAGARVRAEIGQLVENIPRSMRVAVPVLVEARIARADVQNLAQGMRGEGAAQHHEVKITRVMSVNLRAPDGGFFIEGASPETQFIDGTHALSADDFASWRWHVTPREKGRKRLQLVISGRAVADGIVAETALPDQVVTVRVKTNYGRSFVRVLGWAIAAIAGGLVAKFGEGAFDTGLQTLSRFIHH